MQKRVFITGAAGFIGYHLGQALHSRGDVVQGFDNFNGYYDPQLKRDRAKLLDFEVLEGDITEKSLEAAIEKFQPTHIVHLAAQAGVRYSLVNPQAYIKTNVEGFTNVLEICRKMPHVPLIYASSSSVYGANEKIPYSEADRTDHPVSLYGATKKSNEVLAQSYHHLFGIKTTGLRFFTVYGPYGRPDMALFLFTDAILKGKPIDLFNHGKMERDFTYIDDIVSGTVAAIDLGSECEIFNLGNHQSVNLLRFVEIIEKSLGKEANKNFKPMQPGDVLRTFADIEKSQQMLKFTPKTALEVGVPKFIEWYRSYYKI